MVELRGKFKAVTLGIGFVLLFLFAMSLFGSGSAYAAADGKKVYESRCTICHGAKGDGMGLVGIVHRYEKHGMVWKVYPRDFTTATFKFRTTPTGCLPQDKDLLMTVENGIPRAYMPSSVDLSMDERKAVVEYVKTFSPRWKEEKSDATCKPVNVKKPAFVGTADSVVKGEKVWKDMKCWECHGERGRGDGTKSDSLKDDWGNQILPFDFTSGATKMGFAPENVFTAYTTGLDGAGMPSYMDSLSEENRWHLVSFTLKLMGRL